MASWRELRSSARGVPNWYRMVGQNWANEDDRRGWNMSRESALDVVVDDDPSISPPQTPQFRGSCHPII